MIRYSLFAVCMAVGFVVKSNQFLLAPYFGPGLLPHAQKLWIDELAVGTKQIGPVNRSDLEIE